MQHIYTLSEYCQYINIPKPRHSSFDIRRFEDNMRTVRRKVDPFRHEFYAISVVNFATGTTQTGDHVQRYDEQTYTLLFNSPYQLLSWDIALDWQGYYILFTEDFIRSAQLKFNLMVDFPFLRLDQSIPFTVSEEDSKTLNLLFGKIHREYHGDEPDKFQLISGYTYLLMLYVRRSFEKQQRELFTSEHNRTRDIQLLSRFQTLIETAFHPDGELKNSHLVQSYADHLYIHPNHLNAVVKRITGKTAKQIIQERIIVFAKSLLLSTELDISEVAYRLQFDEPTHFSSFFKRQTGTTPSRFRKS